MGISVRQTLTADDLFNFSMVSFLRSPLGRVVFVLYVLGIVFSTVYFITAANLGQLTLEVWAWTLFLTVGLPVVIALSMWVGSKSLVKKHTDRFRDMRMELSDEGVAAFVNGTEKYYAWEAYRFALETKQHFLLYFTPKQAHMLKKTAFRNPTELDAARTLLRQKLRMR